MPSLGIQYFLWNHVEPGMVLERVLSQTSIDHVSIPLVTGPRAQFRPVFFPDQPTFETLGGWHYRPDEAGYAGAGVHPTPADWLSGPGPLDAVLDSARHHNLKVAFRLDLTEAPAILVQVRDALQQDAWGQTRFDHRACINQPRIRELIRAAIADVMRFGAVAVQLENIELDSRCFTCGWTDAHARFSMHLPVSSMCFCAACRQIASAAGIDAALAAQHERERDTRVHAVGLRPHGQPEEPISPVLQAYIAARVADFDRWMAQLAAAVAPLRLFTASYVWRQHLPPVVVRAHRQLPSALPAMWLHAHVESRRKDGKEWNPTEPYRPEDFEAFAPPVAAASIDLRIADVVVPAERFEQAARLFIKAGANWIEFDGLEEAHRDALAWLTQIVASLREHPDHNEDLSRRIERKTRRFLGRRPRPTP